jgi:hypothetical protein
MYTAEMRLRNEAVVVPSVGKEIGTKAPFILPHWLIRVSQVTILRLQLPN